MSFKSPICSDKVLLKILPNFDGFTDIHASKNNNTGRSLWHKTSSGSDDHLHGLVKMGACLVSIIVGTIMESPN